MHVQTKCLYLLYIDTINSENPLTHPTSVCSDSNFCQQVPYKNNLLDFGTELLADGSARFMRHKLATSRFNCYRITKVHVLALCPMFMTKTSVTKRLIVFRNCTFHQIFYTFDQNFWLKVYYFLYIFDQNFCNLLTFGSKTPWL